MRPDARLHPRFQVDAHADIIGDEVMLGRPLVDLSLGGCRFGGPAWETPGREVDLVLIFDREVFLPVSAVVVRGSETDMGVRFVNLTKDQKWTLRKYLRQLQTDQPISADGDEG